MSDWVEKPLSQLAEARRGITYSSAMLDATEKGLPYVNMKSFLKGGGYNREGLKRYSGAYTEQDIVGPRDLLIANTDVTAGDIIGVPALLPNNLASDQVLYSHHVTRLRISGNISREFLYYLLCLPESRSQMLRIARGTTVLMLDMPALKRVPIRAPVNLHEQNGISELLITIDEAIEETESLIAKYQQIKAGLMHDLFTRGVTPDGKLRPPREQAPELYQETPIGWIPKEWQYSKLKTYVKSAEYGISSSLTGVSSGIAVLRMNNIQNGKFDVSDVKYSNDIEAYKLKLRYGDVLFNRTNSMEHVGKTAIWRNQLDKCSFASYLVRINLYCKRLIPDFFAYWISQESSQNAIRRFATPAVQQVNINPTNLQKIDIALANDLKEQQKIVDILRSHETFLEMEIEKLEKLRHQKLGLMHDLLTGKVHVKFAQASKDALHV